tara:strand:- start:31 stop:549 length:519 start_codon:yes stop_codon:yes gene_type:complete
MKNIVNIVAFQLSWWGCILGAAKDLTYLGPAMMIVFLIVHYFLFVTDIRELYLVAIFGVIGTLIDSLMFLSGSFIYSGSYTPDIFVAPLWITAMWAGFSATVNHSMSWLKGKWLLMVVAGIVFGPVAYFTGEKFGAIEFHLSFLSSVIVIAIVWGLSMPLIYYVNQYIGLDE